MFLVVLTIANFFNVTVNGKCCKEKPLLVPDDGVDVGGSNIEEPEQKPEPKPEPKHQQESAKKSELKKKLTKLLADYEKLEDQSGISINIKPEQIDNTADEKLEELEKNINDLIDIVDKKLAAQGTPPDPIDKFKDIRNELIKKLDEILKKHEELKEKDKIIINVDENQINKASGEELSAIENKLNELDKNIEAQLASEKSAPAGGTPPAGGPPAIFPGSKAVINSLSDIGEVCKSFSLASNWGNFNEDTEVVYKGKTYQKNMLLKEEKIAGDKFKYNDDTELFIEDYKAIVKQFLRT